MANNKQKLGGVVGGFTQPPPKKEQPIEHKCWNNLKPNEKHAYKNWLKMYRMLNQ